MRLFLALALFAGSAIAVPANDLQFVIGTVAEVVEPAVLHASHDVDHHGPVETNMTIYEYLSQQDDFTKLVKLIDFDEKYVDVLNSTTDSVTFFAPDNKALTPKKKKDDLSLETLYQQFESVQAADDDDEKKKRFKWILHALLKYHTLPTAIPKPGLYLNTTYETALPAYGDYFGGKNARIQVSDNFLGALSINWYVSVGWKSVNATNGFLYTINHPLIPPPSILEELFLVDQFSTLTSALQKVGLDDKLQWTWEGKEDGHWTGDGPTVSLFAPNNFAFKRLPPRLRFWLFSPAGEKALKKLLSYHIVPDFILHADFVYNGTSNDEVRRTGNPMGAAWTSSNTPAFNVHKCARKQRRMLRKFAETFEWPGHHFPPTVPVNITVPTLLEEHDLHFVVVKPNRTHHFDQGVGAEGLPFSRGWVVVNNVTTLAEGVARNGAVYGIPKLLNPFRHHCSEDKEWDDWEEWLPTWADQ